MKTSARKMVFELCICIYRHLFEKQVYSIILKLLPDEANLIIETKTVFV